MGDDEVTPEQLAAAEARSRANSSVAGVGAGLDDARATLAEIWRRTLDDDHRHRCMRAMSAVIAAERTMRAADAFMLAKTRGERAAAFEQLRISCILRLGPNMRSKP